jgi:hypothetical protein
MKLENFLSLMENFPYATFADEENGLSPEEIQELAAEIRVRANIPRPERALMPFSEMGEEFPADWVPSRWEYQGKCNGCCGPLYWSITEPEPDVDLEPLTPNPK